jgi:2-methylcitrate dehydratase PrpD
MPSVEAAIKGLLMMGTGDVPVLGRVERLSLPDAALIGSLSASAHTFDDTHLSTITHPTGPVAAALLACAYQLGEVGQPVSGEELLTALAVGIELECRVSCAIAQGGANQGWYMTGLSGGIGAAAAVGRLLKLNPQQMVYAIGLAAMQASGTRATHGSMAITFVPGIAARDGTVAAYMAATDFSCSAIAIDGKNGLLQVLTSGHDAHAIDDALGVRYEMLNNAYKPYPCGIVIHPSIDACLHLVRDHKLNYQDIERIELSVHPDALNLCWRKLPDNVLDAQVSLYHWIAACMVFGRAGVADGELDAVMHTEVRALQERAHATVDTAMGSNQALVVVYMRDGTKLERKTEDVTGSVTNPMSDAQLSEKFIGLVAPILGLRRAQVLLDKCLTMSAVHGAAEILQLGAQ